MSRFFQMDRNYASAGGGVGADLSGSGQSHLCHHRAHQLIDQNGEQHDIADDGALGTEVRRHGNAHAQSHTGLRQQ